MNNNNNITMDMFEFFNEIDDLTNDFIDVIELEPIKLSTNLYATGLRRTSITSYDIEIHIKKVNEIKLPNIDKTITDDDGLYLVDTDEQMWVNTKLIQEEILMKFFEQFKANFNKLQTFHILELQYKQNPTMTQYLTCIYKNKKIACKDTLKMKRKYKNTQFKFTIFNNNNNITYEPSDYEIAIAAAEEII